MNFKSFHRDVDTKIWIWNMDPMAAVATIIVDQDRA